MPLKANSILYPLYMLTLESREKIYQKALALTVARAEEQFGGGANLVARTLRPSDWSETNDVWAETVSATTNAWEDSLVAAQIVTADRVVGVYGVYDASTDQAVSGVRVSTGGAQRRAEWDMFLLRNGDTRPEARTGLTWDPVIIPENVNVTIQYYVYNSSPAVVRGVQIVIIGVVVEKVGRILQP